MLKKKHSNIFILFILILISVTIGPAETKIIDILTLDRNTLNIILETRLPRTITVILTAASISISGLIIQNINRNKYISPSTMGTTAGTQIGLLFLFIFAGSKGHLYRFIFGFIFSMITSFFFVFMVRDIKSKNSSYIPLVGIIYSNILGAIALIISAYFDLSQWFQGLSIGTFSHIISYNHHYIYLVLPPLVIAYIYANKFTVVGMGESFAKNIGINYKIIMGVGLVIVSTISSISFIVVGSIPLFGLIIPNIASIYYGDNIKNTIFDIGVLGGILLLFCDILSKIIIFPFEVPISVITSVIGAIVFLFLLLKRRRA